MRLSLNFVFKNTLGRPQVEPRFTVRKVTVRHRGFENQLTADRVAAILHKVGLMSVTATLRIRAPHLISKWIPFLLKRSHIMEIT